MSDPHPLDPLSLFARQGWVEGLARGLVRDSSFAQDLTQEAWLVAARSGRVDPDDPDDSGALRGFLAAVVRNLRSSAARGAGRRERRERIAARPEASEPGSPKLPSDRPSQVAGAATRPRSRVSRGTDSHAASALEACKPPCSLRDRC
jgi:DNA-directed RNA polymerase specialized sigma24 family protein